MPSANLGLSDPLENELIHARQGMRTFGNQDGGTIVLVQLLQTRREIDVIPMHGIAEPVTGSDQSPDHDSRVYAHPRSQTQAITEGLALEDLLYL